MEIRITGTPNEIAALTVTMRERQDTKEISDHVRQHGKEIADTVAEELCREFSSLRENRSGVVVRPEHPFSPK